MQFIFQSLQTAFGSRVSLAVGLLLLGAIALQLLFLLFTTARRAWAESRADRLAAQHLALRVREARIRCQEAEQARAVWNGYRKFTVQKKIHECDDVWSFHLVPHDGRPLPPFKPGQYLTFKLDIPGQDKPVVRCYSISDRPRPDLYRVTIKREKAPPDKPGVPPGVGSGYFCDVVKEGDILNVKAPAGHFFLDMLKNNPVVIIGGGVGVTPIVSMAGAVAAAKNGREVWFFYGARNRREQMLKQEIEQLAAAHENIRLHVSYSRPTGDDLKGRDYHHDGHVSPGLLKELLPSNNYEFYLCGNGGFMKSITDGLEAWGVPEKDIYFEAFGPASVKKKTAPPPPSETVMLSKVEVTFARSAKTVRWEPAAGNLLEFAQSQGVRIDSGCCAGSCGSCLVAVKSGEVTYLKQPDAEPEAGSCLTCVCRPKGNLVLDA